MAGQAQTRAGLALLAILSVSALVALTLRFVADESEPEITEPEASEVSPAEPSSEEVLVAPEVDAGIGVDAVFVPRPGIAGRSVRQTSVDLEELEVVAEHHDFTPEEQRQVAALLRAEQEAVDRLVARNEFDEFALIGEIEDLREDTDNAVEAVLTGYPLIAYKLMREPGYESERDDDD